MSFIDGFSDFALRGEVSDRVRSAAEQAAAGVWGAQLSMGRGKGAKPPEHFQIFGLI
jgi:hypothetical protein